MKGVVLARGNGTRLYPLTKLISKHLLPVGKYPMIYYCVDKMRNAGITNILLVGTNIRPLCLLNTWEVAATLAFEDLQDSRY